MVLLKGQALFQACHDELGPHYLGKCPIHSHFIGQETGREGKGLVSDHLSSKGERENPGSSSPRDTCETHIREQFQGLKHS